MSDNLICLTCGNNLVVDELFDVYSSICFSCGDVGKFTKTRRITSSATSIVLEALKDGLKPNPRAASHKVYRHKLADEKKIAKAFRSTFRTLINHKDGMRDWAPPKVMRTQEQFLDGTRKEYNMPKRMTKTQIEGDSIGELYEHYFCHLVADHPRMTSLNMEQRVYLANGEMLLRGKPDFAYLYQGKDETMTIPVELKTVKEDVFDHGKLRDDTLKQVSRYAYLGQKIGWSNRPICALILVARDSGRCTTMIIDDRYYSEKDHKNKLIEKIGVLDARLKNHDSGKVPLARAWNLLSEKEDFESLDEGDGLLSIDKWVINAVQARIDRVNKRTKKVDS